jgi:hypothetical protein
MVLALCGPAFAGEIHNPPAAPPPQQATPGEIPNPPAALIDALLALLGAALP